MHTLLANPWFILSLVVVLAPIAAFLMRFKFGAFHAQWLSEYPAQAPRVDATSRHPGYISVADARGNVYWAVMDTEYLHLVPDWPARTFFGMRARSIPWSELSVVQVKEGQATAQFGTYHITAPEWMLEPAMRRAAR